MTLIVSSLRYELPSSPARAGWEIDTQAFIAALDYLGIARFVKVRFTAGKRIVGRHGPRYFRYWNEDGTRGPGITYHRIKISQDRPFEFARVTIWHELTHAQQAETFAVRTGRPMTFFYREEYKLASGAWGASYEENSYEIAARALADARPWEIIRERR